MCARFRHINNSRVSINAIVREGVRERENERVKVTAAAAAAIDVGTFVPGCFFVRSIQT